MNERNVLVIAYRFPPMGISGVLRTTKFVKYLCDYGWRPTVLTGTPRTYSAYDDSLMRDFTERPVVIERTDSRKEPVIAVARGRSEYSSGLISQPDAIIRWKKHALRVAEKIMHEKEIHCIFATAPPFSDFIIAKEISEKYKIPYVMDYRESWNDNGNRGYHTVFHRSMNERMESDVLKTASKVIVCHRLAKERLLMRYRFMRHEDICIIPSGYDAEDFLPYIAFRPNPDKLTISHCGMFERDESPKNFLKALAKLKKQKPETENFVEARFIGALRPSDIKYIKKSGLEKMTWVTGYVPHREAVGLMAESDVLWFTSRNEHDAPGKIFEYFGAKRPIFCLTPENAASLKIAAETKAVFHARPNSVKEISTELGRIVDCWLRDKMPKVNDTLIRNLNYYDLTSDLSREIAIVSMFRR